MSTSNDSWLSDYYTRIQSDCTLAFERRDKITNWSYAILAAVIAAYAGFFADGNFVSALGRFGLVAGVLFVLIRFFFQSMIAYGYFLRGRYLRTRIEKYWMHGDPTIDKIKNDIKTLDHEKKIPETGRNRLMAQIRSGFLLILAIPTIPLGIEMYLKLNPEYFVIIGFLFAYVIAEIINFKKYDQTEIVEKSS